MYASNGYVRNGLGREYGDDGNSVIYNGDWKEGKRSGHGVWYKDGDDMETYNGELLNDRPNGEGSLFDESGQLLYKGVWRNGILRVGGKAIDYRTGEETTESEVSVIVMESDSGVVDKEKENSGGTHVDMSYEDIESSGCDCSRPWNGSYCLCSYYNGYQLLVSLAHFGYGLFLALMFDIFLIQKINNNFFYACTITYSLISVFFLFCRQSSEIPFFMMILILVFTFVFYLSLSPIDGGMGFIFAVPLVSGFIAGLMFALCLKMDINDLVTCLPCVSIILAAIFEGVIFYVPYYDLIALVPSAYFSIMWFGCGDVSCSDMVRVSWFNAYTYVFTVQLALMATQASIAIGVVSALYGVLLIAVRVKPCWDKT